MQRLKAILASAVVAFSLCFALATPVLADTTSPDIQNGVCTGANLQFTDNPTPGACTGSNATDSINKIIHTIVNLLSAIVGIVAVIMIIVGGLRYITSGGNDASVTSAKNTILYAIIGLVIVFFAQVLVRFTLSKITNS